jgi:hypothetical protein
MSQEAERRCYRIVIGLGITWLCCTGPARAADDLLAERGTMPLFDSSRDMLRAERPLHGRDLGAVAIAGSGAYAVQPLRKQIDVSPVLDEVFGFLHRHGVPLQEQLDEDGAGPVGVYADFSVGRDMPAVSFHLGDRPIEPLGAFYSNERGFRCAVVWPISRFTLRLEGGEDSEFGYYGIAGVQWLDPHRPLAIGIGIPMNLRNADGDVGFIFQLRMNLD